MSSIIFNESLPIGSATCGRRLIVDTKQPETLGEYVQRVRGEQRMSLTDVAKKSGGEITGSYVNRIENGVADSDSVTPKKLWALAKGLGVSAFELFAIAIGEPVPEDVRQREEHKRLIEMFEDIPRLCQHDVLDLLAVLQRNHSISTRKNQIAARTSHAATSNAREVEPPTGAVSPKEQRRRRVG